MQLPETLLRSLEGVEGFDREAFEYIHSSGEQVVSVRANPAKALTSQLFPGSERIPWCGSGFYLPERPSFTFDPRFHAGAYYVQEASSMFLEQAVRQHADLSEDHIVLDLCAAPGGKSTLLQSLISPNSILVCNDVIKSRASILEENLSKWGAVNTVISNNDPRDIGALSNFFDIMVVDAPCSGSGLFRRDPALITEWSTDVVRLCNQRQQRILSDVYPALAQGGLLIYATCSYSREEDEEIVDWLLKNHELESLPIKANPSWKIIETISKMGGTGYRFFPDKLRGEGFFLACFRKKDGLARNTGIIRKNKKDKNQIVSAEKLIPFADPQPDMIFTAFGDRILAMPESLFEVLPLLQKHLYLRKAGTVMGKSAQKGLIPDHELALSNLCGKEVVDIALKLDDALQYLRKEAVILSGARAGWATVSFEQYRLGWVKILSGRMNNYYPQAWRILKSQGI